MADLLESLVDGLDTQSKTRDERVARHSRSYRCRCGNHIFFDNTLCLACRSPLGLLPDEGRVAALDPGPTPGTWRVEGRSELSKFCANRDSPAACNWMMYARNPKTHCIACRLNRTIPNLDDADNARYWGKIEAAKRRLVAQLIALGLPVRSKVEEDPERGLMFDFLRSPPQGPARDDRPRERPDHDQRRGSRRRQARADPARRCASRIARCSGTSATRSATTTGTASSGTRKWLEPFRQLFGDERASYAEALKRNYEQGPPADWANSYISSYATMHPWEDWAETWAHYLHVVDSLGTALGFGLDADELEGRHPAVHARCALRTRRSQCRALPVTAERLARDRRWCSTKWRAAWGSRTSIRS